MIIAEKKLTRPHRPFDRKTTTWIILVHLGCLLAPFTFTWRAFTAFGVVYGAVGGLGIAMCYHRLLSHRSFKVPRPVEYFLTILGCMAAQRSPIFWIARHRQHHAATDLEGDPHSPREGFWWAHMIWAMKDLRVQDENEYFGKIAPDLARDAGHRFIEKTHELWPLLLASVMWMAGGLSFMVWGFFVPLVVIYHCTWLVNSMGHIWGYRNYETRDTSRNNPVIAVLSFGEGWHNNHHACPGLARNWHRFWEMDITYLVIRLMGLAGIARDIRK